MPSDPSPESFSLFEAHLSKSVCPIFEINSFSDNTYFKKKRETRVWSSLQVSLEVHIMHDPSYLKTKKHHLNYLPSVSLAFPPVGWQRTVEQPTHKTTVCAWLKTVVIL
jgi:hypothetical protein